MRKFEATYLCISVQALNEAELFYDAYAYPPGEEDLALQSRLIDTGQMKRSTENS
jgi:hypothetical protein